MTDPKQTPQEPQQTGPKQPEKTAAAPTGGLNTEKAAPQQPIVIEQKGGGKGLAVGALVLSILALGSSGFLFVQGQNTFKNQEIRVTQELEKAALGDSQNAVLLQNSLKKQEELAQAIAAAQDAQKTAGEDLKNVNRAYAELLKGRVNWLVDEVEVTLNLASQQLVLSGNVPVVVSVLESIDQRLNRFDQPELLPIKQAVSQDLTALKTRPYLNVPGTVLRIDRLESAVAGLPLLVDNTLQASPVQPAPVSQTGDFWTRTWEGTTNLIKGMVEVRKLESNDAMLLAPEQIYFVRENLRLRLLDARVALLQHNGEVYQNDLGAAEATVKQYFDVRSPNTQAWLKDIAELKALDIRMISDDALKASQAAVRNYQNNVRTAVPVFMPEVNPAATSEPRTVTPALIPEAGSAATSEPRTAVPQLPSAGTPAAVPQAASAAKPAASAPAAPANKSASAAKGK